MTRSRTHDRSIWSAILSDPTLRFDRETLGLVVTDQQRWSRRWLHPVARVCSRIAVMTIMILKLLVPFRAHVTMDRLCVWFLRRCVAPEAATLLIRHFIVETNLLEFLLRNTGVQQHGVQLRPTTIDELGNRAVIEHDVNVYDTLTAVGAATRRRPLCARSIDQLDFSMLDVPPIDAEPEGKRLLRLDIQTALCLMNIPFALCLTRDEYRRAVHSMRLDESLLRLFATITGDLTFMMWQPPGTMVRVDSTADVPRAVYEHAVLCEYAHAHLRSIAKPPAHANGRRALSPGYRQPLTMSGAVRPA